MCVNLFNSFRLTFLVISLVYGITCTAQPPEYFSREKLKGLNQVEVTYGKKREGNRMIFTIDKDGDVVRSEGYNKGKLNGWDTYEYDGDGRLVLMTTYHEIYPYDETTKTNIAYLGEDTFRKSQYEYSGDLVTKIVRTTSILGSVSTDRVTTFEYDHRNRLIQETDTDSTMGLSGKFSPNSSKIDSMYWITEPTIDSVTYEYSGNKIVRTSRGSEGNIEGYEITTVNKANKPVRKIEQNDRRVVFRTTSFHYDKKGRLFREKVNFLDRERIPYDYSGIDETEITYNDQSLPERITNRVQGKVVNSTRFVYRK